MSTAKRSAGLLIWRRGTAGPEVLLAHMGGPLWARKDEHAWSIPKGEYGPDEEPLAAAYREFAEEMGSPAPPGDPVPLGEVVQRNGKVVVAWAIEGDFDADAIISNGFEMEWPPRSGHHQTFPEVDRAGWFGPDVARSKLVTAQAGFVDRAPWDLDDGSVGDAS